MLKFEDISISQEKVTTSLFREQNERKGINEHKNLQDISYNRLEFTIEILLGGQKKIACVIKQENNSKRAPSLDYSCFHYKGNIQINNCIVLFQNAGK
jgi:hypothetical protein